MNGGHRDRVKDQFKSDGFNNMKDYHILEMILFYAVPRIDTKPTAHHLIDYFGSFTKVLDAEISELVKVEGVGQNSAILIKMMIPIMRRYLEEKTTTVKPIKEIDEIAKMLITKYMGVPNEQVYLVCMNNKNHILQTILLHEGTINATEITARKVVETAFRTNASKVILAHNHPQSEPIPSNADIIVTDAIGSALKQMNLELLDHIIVGQSDYTSMAESGFITKSYI